MQKYCKCLQLFRSLFSSFYWYVLVTCAMIIIIIIIQSLHRFDKCFLSCSVWHEKIHLQNWTHYHQNHEDAEYCNQSYLLSFFNNDVIILTRTNFLMMMRPQFFIVTFIHGQNQSMALHRCKGISQDTIYCMVFYLRHLTWQQEKRNDVEKIGVEFGSGDQHISLFDMMITQWVLTQWKIYKWFGWQFRVNSVYVRLDSGGLCDNLH